MIPIKFAFLFILAILDFSSFGAHRRFSSVVFGQSKIPIENSTVSLASKTARTPSPAHANSTSNVTTIIRPTTASLTFPTFETIDWVSLQPAARLDYSVFDPIICRVGVVLTKNAGTNYDHNVLSPALEVAYTKARADYNVDFHVGNYLYEVSGNAETPDPRLGKTQGCWMWNASGAAAQAINESMQLIIGPACTHDMHVVNELSSFFHVPTITGAANLIDYADNHDLLTRFGFNIFDMWSFVVKMFEKYEWYNVVLFYNTDDIQTTTEASTFLSNLKNAKINVYDIQLNGTQFENFDRIDGWLLEGRLQARIFVFLLDAPLTRFFLIHATKLGMADGSYLFFTVDLFRDSVLKNHGWKNRDGYDRDAFTAYQHLFIMSIKDNTRSPQYVSFEQDVRDFGSHQQNIPPESVAINYFSSTFYDGILMFAMAARSVLGSTRNILQQSDVNVIINRGLWNQSYNGVSGTVYINEKGDRSDDLTMYFMTNLENGTFTVVAQYLGVKQTYEELINIPWRTVDGQPLSNIPPCGYKASVCANTTSSTSIIAGVLGPLVLIATLVCSVVAFRAYRKRALNQMDWLIEPEELNLNSSISAGSRSTLNSSISSRISLNSNDVGSNRNLRGKRSSPSKGKVFFTSLQGRLVMVIKCENRVLHLNSSLNAEIANAMRMINDNVLRFLGACIAPNMVCVVGEYCSKGSLQDLLADESHKLDWVFRFSLVSDIVKGLNYIHGSTLVYHGRLTSGGCFVDGKFVLKVGDFGLPSFYDKMHISEDRQYYRSLFWTAPEHIETHNSGSQEGDVYSFGIIMQEIILREEPYSMYQYEPQEIIQRVLHPEGEIFRPQVKSSECPFGFLSLMDQCWQHDPTERPRLAQIKNAIRQVTKGAVEKSNIFDLLLARMEEYSRKLEQTVEEKTRAFQDEKRKADALLAQILPGAVAEKLRRGETVPPEIFDSATIYFSDIVGFQELTMESTGIQIVDFLNDLYSLFDETIPNFDVYKVETIHDSYMVASGLPNRNGLNHVKEIAKLSLNLMRLIYNFKIRHRSNEIAKLRIGLNTGPVVASVIGLAVPRYCLFGDTVNTASRMESSGEGLKIQISSTTKSILDGFGGFEVAERGEIDVKGKGMMKTFWLLRELGVQNITGQ